MKIHEDIRLHAAAEFLAKKDEFAKDGLEPYLNTAQTFFAGQQDAVPDVDIQRALTIQGLMVYDDEQQVLQLYPELQEVYKEADALQIRLTKSTRNLDFYKENGVSYEFDPSKAAESAMLAKGGPLSIALMREKIVRASGFKGVRVNYLYHDVLDHLWLLDYLRKNGLAEKYDDFMQAVGDPFHGSLLSREAELLSGIGFTSRRYLSEPGYYANLSLNTGDVVEYLDSSDARADGRIIEASETIQSDAEIATWSGYVIKSAIANILAQRERSGAVKELALENGDFVPVGKVVSLLDPRYVALIINTVAELSKDRSEYLQAQIQLNRQIESMLIEYTRTGQAVGSIALSSVLEPLAEPIDPRNPIDNIGISTSYF